MFSNDIITWSPTKLVHFEDMTSDRVPVWEAQAGAVEALIL